MIASQQPMHVPLGDMNAVKPSGPWPDNIGPERASRAWAWKSIRDAGGRVAFGSDWPVAPLDAGQGIWLAATRVAPANAVAQTLPMGDVLDGYTRWPAYASFEEQRKGSIAPGCWPTSSSCRPTSWPHRRRLPADIVVETTIFDGRVVYTRR